ncbi:MAG: sodium:calcium antiporter, partial [Bacteroidales bacterium]|nr:sodium:calcium antiporter [Bacteroidales bacterium]
MILQIFLLCLGLGLLIKGADWLVDGGSALARRYKVPDLAIGLTVIAFGTSMPEFVVNTFAAFQGNGDIVYGNIIGSNNFNLYVILGIAGLITPLVVSSGTVRREIPFSLMAVIILFLLSNSFLSENKVLSRFDGLILLIFFGLFLYYVLTGIKSDVISQELKHKEMPVVKIWLFIIAGLIFLV